MISPVAAAVVRRQHKIVAAFRAAGATREDRATTVAALAIDEGMAFRQLRHHGVVREAGERLVYLDEPRWEAHRVKRRRIAARVIGTMLLAALVVIVWALLLR